MITNFHAYLLVSDLVSDNKRRDKTALVSVKDTNVCV